MHELLGLNERLVFEACRAVPMVGQRFSNWAKGAPPFVLGYDDEPPPGGDLPFSQYWAKGALEGLRVGFEDFSLGSACARLGRVPIARDEAAPVSASYGYHIDAPIYSELFKQLALRMGIETFRSGNVDLDVTGEQIKAVVLDDGSRIEADLYVDASGPEARLIGKMAGAEFESWRGFATVRPSRRSLGAALAGIAGVQPVIRVPWGLGRTVPPPAPHSLGRGL